MAIKVTLSSGITSTKTSSLFQWDYGQQLEIVSDDLPPIVEVHFACKGMSEAVVVPCSIADGTGIVTIPDSCLEQSTDITAWVYSIDGTQGKTVKTITIPIVSRIRPGRSETIPQGVSDKYTELISQVNDAIGDLKDGTVTVKKAETAETSNRSTSATNASFANTANGVSINGRQPFQAPTEIVTHLPGAGYYCVISNFTNVFFHSTMFYWDGIESGTVGLLGTIVVDSDGTMSCEHLYVDSNGELSVELFDGSGMSKNTVSGYTFKVAKLWG